MDPAILALMIPILAIVAAFGIPMVAMLLKHQQKMAELMHTRSAIDPRIDALSADLATLKDLVHQQTIALDRISNLALPAQESIEQRTS